MRKKRDMTRLITEWISEMEDTAATWNEELKDISGLGYIDLAAAVSGHSITEILEASETMKVAAVPITSGLGVIGSFAESVAAIVRAMGFDAFVTEATDVNGLYEAKVKDADIVFMADDDRYIALNMHTGAIGDNNIGTAAGYAEILRNMAGGLDDRPVAVLGYGIIGQLLAGNLAKAGARVGVYDKDPAKKELVDADGYLWLERDELKEYHFIADGTCEGEWLSLDDLAKDEEGKPDVIISTPGIPLSLDEEAKETMEGKYVNDMLEIGTAVMLGLAI